jgi:hypothetical protein
VAVAHVRDVEIHGRGNAPWAAHAVAIAVAVQIEVPHLGTADVDFFTRLDADSEVAGDSGNSARV